MRLLSKLALVWFGFCHGVDVVTPPLVRREGAEKSTETESRLTGSNKPMASVVESNAEVIQSREGGADLNLGNADGSARKSGLSSAKEENSGIYGEAMDDSLSRFLVSSQALSEQNLESLQIGSWENDTRSIELGTRTPTAADTASGGKLQAQISKLEADLTNALEVAKVAEAAATNATAMVAKQGAQLRAADKRIEELEGKEAADAKDLGRMQGALDDAKNRSNMTEAELAGIEAKEFQLGTKQENVNTVVKDIEGKMVEFGRAAVHAEQSAQEAESDATKAKNSSDLLKAREANVRYEMDDLETSLNDVFKEQNITRKAVQLLLLKALGLGKTITEIDGSMKLVNGSLSSVVRQALESLKLAKEAKEEADDALDDVETAGAGPTVFSGGYTRATPSTSKAAWTPQPSSSGSRVVVSSSYDATAAATATQHAKAAWEAVKQMQAQNGKSRPVYEVASMTGDLIQITKGPQGPAGAPGAPGADGERGKRGPPGVQAELVDNLTDETDESDENSTNTSIVHVPHIAPHKGASVGLYFVALAVNLIALWLLYKSVDAILVTGDLSARPWSKRA